MIRRQVCIAHGHGQAGVTQDFLHGEDVPTVLDEVAGEGVAQGAAERGDGRVRLTVLLLVPDDLGFQLCSDRHRTNLAVLGSAEGDHAITQAGRLQLLSL